MALELARGGSEALVCVSRRSVPAVQSAGRRKLLRKYHHPTARSQVRGSWSFGQASKQQQQDWILKCLQGGQAHPLAVCGVATLSAFAENPNIALPIHQSDGERCVR